jgi:hypothetical protein
VDLLTVLSELRYQRTQVCQAIASLERLQRKEDAPIRLHKEKVWKSLRQTRANRTLAAGASEPNQN